MRPGTVTGPTGARVNRPVALVTDDFRAYHQLAPFFESRGVHLLGLRPGEPVPEAVQVVIGDVDDPRGVPLADVETTWIRTAAALTGRRDPRRVVLGVDPGETFGLALLADAVPLHWDECYGLEDAVERAARWASAWGERAVHVHVGDGAPAIGRSFRRALRAACPECRISMVSEDASTPRSAQTGSRHVDAAILIAMREP